MDLSFRFETLITAACNARMLNAHSGGGGFFIEPCYPSFWHFLGALIRVPVQAKGASEKSMKLCALANWRRGNKVPFSVQNANHFLYAWNTLMGFPEKTDPYVFKTISHLDIEGLQDYYMSLINGSRRTLAGN